MYFEEATGEDLAGDRFEITFSGGAPGTQLKQLIINTDKGDNGLTIGDVFFDTAAGGQGAFGHVPVEIVDQTGIDSVQISVEDGGMRMVITFTGFDAGERLVFTVDVDEQGSFVADEGDDPFLGANAVAEGNEFQGSQLTATFTAPYFPDVFGTGTFLDFYDTKLANSGLTLPPDSYVPPGSTPRPVQTAGTMFAVEQPSTISGRVVDDANGDGVIDAGEVGIAGVTVYLLDADGNRMAETQTDENGHYQFADLRPGVYAVQEMQPGGYHDGRDYAGSAGGSLLAPDSIIDVRLVSGTRALNYDFLEYRPSTIRGSVIEDTNGNGLIDAGETGIPSVTVYLLDADGNRIAETQTDDSGRYQFADLRPGVYGVEELQPTGYEDGRDHVGSVGGSLVAPDSITGVRLVSGTNAVNYDFLDFRLSTISGRVIDDANGDGAIDAGEIGIPFVTVYLLDAQGNHVGETTTDADGRYRFTGLLPGVYGVEEHQPTGYEDGRDHVGSVGGSLVAPDSITGVRLVSGTNAVNYDFLDFRLSTISGRVIDDANGDGAIDAGEVGIPFVTVYLLDAQGNRVGETTADADGRYQFTGLLPGVYGVEESQPEGYHDGRDHVGTAGGSLLAPDSITDIRLVSGTDAVNYDFLDFKLSTISGHVIADANGNGVYDPGEAPIAGVTVYLLDAGGNRIASARTGDRGLYRFTDLAPGSYGVEEIQPEGYFDGQDHPGTAGGSLVGLDSIREITLVSGTNAADYDFLEILPSSISGRVLADANGNCQLDPGESLLAGVTVHLLDAGGNRIARTVTDENGEYLFDGLAPGTYGVEEIQPEGYFDGPDHPGSAGGTRVAPDSIVGIVLVSGTEAVRYNFCERVPVTLSGFVYHDVNNNGQRNAGEAGIEGVTLTLLDGEGNATGITAVTNSSGYYQFSGLKPGNVYGVAEVQPDGYFDGLDTAGTAGGTAENPGDRITGIALGSGVHGKNYNFGELRPASIGGRIFVDRDEDDRYDPGEKVLSGVTVYLLDASGERIASTATDTNGQYSFANLRPGTYGVEEDQPDGYFDGKDYVGSAGGTLADDLISQVVLGSGVDAVDYNFCELPPAKISGYVFQDGTEISYEEGDPTPDPVSLRDGQFTPDDIPIAGVTLQLADANGAAILDADGRAITAVTNSRGYYEFANLRPRVYSILQVQPEGYQDSLDTAGSKGGIAINTNSQISPETLRQLVVDPKFDAIIRIPIAAGDNAVSYNFSEVVMVEVPPPPPVFPPPREDPPPLPLPEPMLMSPDLVQAAWIQQSTLYREVRAVLGGAGNPLTYTWHLSVINAGQPRSDRDGIEMMGLYENPVFNPVSWTGAPLNRGQWTLADTSGTITHQFIFGMEGAMPVTGDFNGDGIDEVAVFFDGLWFIDLNGNGTWDQGDLWVRLGDAGDQPVAGDWDGDGKTDVGVFGQAWVGDGVAIDHEPGLPDMLNDRTGRRKNVPPDANEAASGYRTLKRTAEGEMRSDLIDHVFQYGSEGDRAVAGDWNGDGVTNIGLFRSGTWYLDMDGDGHWSRGDLMLRMGREGDLPVVGDWNGDGIDDLALFREGTWLLDSNGNRKLDAGDRTFKMGGPYDRPVAGDFNGDGIDEVAVYQDSVSKPDEQAFRPEDPAPAESTRRR